MFNLTSIIYILQQPKVIFNYLILSHVEISFSSISVYTCYGPRLNHFQNRMKFLRIFTKVFIDSFYREIVQPKDIYRYVKYRCKKKLQHEWQTNIKWPTLELTFYYFVKHCPDTNVSVTRSKLLNDNFLSITEPKRWQTIYFFLNCKIDCIIYVSR